MPASPGRGPSSATSGFTISVQPANPALPLYSCVSSSEKLMNLCTFAIPVHEIVIIISLDHDWYCSQRTLPQIIVNTCEGEGIETQSKMMVAAT